MINVFYAIIGLFVICGAVAGLLIILILILLEKDRKKEEVQKNEDK